MNVKEGQESLTMRLLHGARDLVWQDDVPHPAATSARPANGKAAEKADAKAEVAVAPTTVPMAAPMAATIATPDSQAKGMSAELLGVVLSRPTAYSALSEAVEALAAMPMDEALRYRSAFAVLKQSQQRTVEQVVQAIDLHLGLLDAEGRRFAAQSDTAEQEGIAARAKEIAALNASAEEINRQVLALRSETETRIRRMQEEQAQKQERARTLGREAEEKQQAIARTTRNFEAAMDDVKTRLTADKARVQRYLA